MYIFHVIIQTGSKNDLSLSIYYHTKFFFWNTTVREGNRKIDLLPVYNDTRMRSVGNKHKNARSEVIMNSKTHVWTDIFKSPLTKTPVLV